MFNLLLNILWLVFGGLELAMGWLLASLIMVFTIIGIPWARAAFNIALLTFFPFGSHAVSRKSHGNNGDLGTGPLGCVGNIIWFIFAGWWLFLGHFLVTIFFFITIIGIPFALQHWKLAKISLAPVGKKIVFGWPLNSDNHR